MAVEVTIPEAGESISEVEVGEWRKAEGDRVEQDEILVEIETDKASMELPAPAAGVLKRILKESGETVAVGDVIAEIDESAADEAADAQAARKQGKSASPRREQSGSERTREGERPADETDRGDRGDRDQARPVKSSADARRVEVAPRAGPAARRALSEHGLSADQVEPTGPRGRVLKEDVLRHVERQSGRQGEPPSDRPSKAGGSVSDRSATSVGPVSDRSATSVGPVSDRSAKSVGPVSDRSSAEPGKERPVGDRSPEARASRATERADRSEREEVVAMSLLRRRIAQRLVESQQNAAPLTTFNECDMSAVMALRKEHGDAFEKRHQVRLGFMSFFVKAAIEALKRVPQVNAEIRGSDIVFKNYYDIGVAVATDAGLVVPVLRDADRLSFGEIEQAIGDMAARARERKLTIEELQGGTFTISNGGVYGSLMSTPIINPPQSGILGLHTIQDRPVAREGQVVIRPMMYLALTYDHRLIDGREAVTFLRHVKGLIETPARMLMEI